MTWSCPRCGRSFRQLNQRHSCGTGDASLLLRNKAPDLVKLYRGLEKIVRRYSGVETVTKDRYALFRTTRIFADLVFMKDALRIAIHLGRAVEDPVFFKVVGDRRHVSHVAKLRDAGELRAVEPYLKEAYEFSLREKT
jgi:hypothetical protein